MAFRRRGLLPEEIEYLLSKTDSEDVIEISDGDYDNESLEHPNFCPPVNQTRTR